MELLTIGQKIHPGREVLLFPMLRESFTSEPGANMRLHLILIQKGTGIIRLAEQRIAFNAPVLLCINEREGLALEQGLDIEAAGLYFHPSVINSAFSFENLRNDSQNLDFTASQDQYWLQAFLDRNEKRWGLFNLAPMTANRIAHYLALVDQELDEQRDHFWPCRSRSYFLELLFLVDRLYREPEYAEIGILSDVTSKEDVGDVILYLHTHYQEKITLAELARNFHTNRTTLTKQFNTVTGLPVMTYLINLRIHLASLMLRNTTISVNEVMQRVGFMDETHFTRTFRKYTHLTPSEYRQRFCWVV